MQELSTYIRAVHQCNELLSVVKQQTETNSYQDGDIEVNRAETLFTFDNGVKLRYSVERDDSTDEPEVNNDLVCEECWISYEVIDGAEQVIRPRRKIFYNACQEKFYLKLLMSR
ncbi:hypothetical protein C942_02876 [Photobacterium marinum]|uniref:Uncharacterized protein n=1 Tax=Photobacterium marinum TaxID=1056511 RepID=L8J9U6_9GAMM|nr:MULTISPECIES: hypothetical protein [Photobacterium]ELR64294.1 hypothetical protein C942_02876 [Photobacterium marinum]